MEESHGAVAVAVLYQAAAIGDVKALHELFENNPMLLDRAMFTCPNKTPLHVATMKGHLTFVREILKRDPQLAEELDTQQSSPLHIASVKGYAEIVTELLSVAPKMCLSRDCQGRNPLHLAAMEGQVEVLTKLVQTTPFAAREKLDGGITVLHLCVKYKQLEALKVLVPYLSDLLDAMNGDGDTILHMAVRDKQVEALQYLVGSTNINVNARNSMKQRAFDILDQSPPDTRDSEIRKILRQKLINFSNKPQTQQEKWLNEKRDAIMVVAVLMATMAFQAVVSPAGGVWQEDMLEDSLGNPVPHPHRAGEAVMASTHATAYLRYLRSNTIVFVSSLSTILLLISGLPFRRRLFMWILMVIMWLTVTSIAVTYVISVYVVTPREFDGSAVNVMRTGIILWSGVMTILLVGNTVQMICRGLTSKGIRIWPPRRFRRTAGVNHEDHTQASV